MRNRNGAIYGLIGLSDVRDARHERRHARTPLRNFQPTGRKSRIFARLKHWASVVKRDVVALWFAARDPHMPFGAKLMAGIAAAYALSPIDLIPDFIPVLGYVDDLILVPLFVWFAVMLVPNGLMAGFRAKAEALSEQPHCSLRDGAVSLKRTRLSTMEFAL